MIVKIVRSWQELAPLAAQWDFLAAVFLTPLLTFNWLKACAGACPASSRLHVVLVYDGGELVAAAPLMFSETSAIPTLRFIGNPYCELYEPSGFLYRDRRSLQTLIDALVSMRLPLVIEKVLETSPMVEMLANVKQRALHLPAGHSTCLAVNSDGDWPGFEARMTKARRDRLKSMRKIANKMGTVRFDVASPRPSEVAAYIQSFMAVEGKSWKFRAGTALVQNPIQQKFLESYAASAADEGSLRVFTMWIGDEPAAMRIAVQHSDRTWEIKIGYDEKFRKCSPGLLLTHETIRYVFEQGLKGHEFLGLEEDWEHIWANEVRSYVWLSRFPLSIKGTAGFGEAATRIAIDRAGKSLTRLASRPAHAR